MQVKKPKHKRNEGVLSKNSRKINKVKDNSNIKKKKKSTTDKAQASKISTKNLGKSYNDTFLKRSSDVPINFVNKLKN